MSRLCGTAGRAVVASCAIAAGSSWHIANAGALATVLSHHYRVSPAVIGLLTSVLFIAELGLMLPAGAVIDRVGGRRVGAAGLALATVATAPLLADTSYAAALLLRALTGLGAGAAFLGGAAYVQRMLGTPLGQGIYGGTGLAAAGVSLAIVPPLSDTVGWRAPWLLAAAATAACLLLTFIGPEDTAARRARPPSMLGLALDGRIVRLGALHAATFAFSVVIGNWTVSLLERAGHASAFAGVVSALTLVIGVLARPAGGYLARREPQTTRAIIRASVVVGAGGSLLLAIEPASTPVALVAASMVGAGGGLPFGILLTSAGDAAPMSPAVAIAAMNSYALGAIIAGTPLLGLTFSLPGAGRVGFAVAAAACLLALPVARWPIAPLQAGARAEGA